MAHHHRGRSVLVIAACSTGPDAAHHDWALGRHLAAEDAWVSSGALAAELAPLQGEVGHGSLTQYLVFQAASGVSVD